MAQIINVSSPNSNQAYTVGDIITINVEFDNSNLFVNGNPRLLLETGTTDRFANFSGRNGSNTLQFTYTVQAGDVSSDLDYFSTTAFDLSEGSIGIIESPDIPDLTLPTPGEAGSLSANNDLVIGSINQAPSAVTLTNRTAALREDTDTTTRIKVADINVTDDDLGTNTLGLTGADAANFEIEGTELFLAAGTNLDFDVQSEFNINVFVDDPTVGGTPDAIADFNLSVNDSGFDFRNLTLGDGFSNVGLLSAESQALIKTAFDLPDSLDLTNFNPLSAAANGDAVGAEVLADLVSLQTLIVQTGETLSGALPDKSPMTLQLTTAMTALEVIQPEAEAGNAVDLGDVDTVKTIFEATVTNLKNQDPSLDLDTVSNNSTAISEVIAASTGAILTTATNNSPQDAVVNIFQAQQVTQNQVANDLEAAVVGIKTFDDVITENTGTNLDTQIESIATNLIPIAVDDVFALTSTDSFAGNVLSDNGQGSDFDFEGTSLTIIAANDNDTLIGNPIQLDFGNLTLNSDGSFIYTPDSSLGNGVVEDSFTYTIADGTGAIDTATVNLNIAISGPSNESPVAVDDIATANQSLNNPKTILASTLLANDTDANGDALLITGVTANAVSRNGKTVGTVTLNDDGNIIYTSTNKRFSGVATFDYTVSDGELLDTGTVKVRVGKTQNGGNGKDILTGTSGDDILNGGNAPDRLSGVDQPSRNPGKGEFDILTGGNGRDTFVLGNDKHVFYQGMGDADLAVITDFGRGPDQIQLQDLSSVSNQSYDFTFVEDFNGLGAGTQISYVGLDDQPDLIGFVQDANISVAQAQFV
ncbi:Ig-like domain-containing protein [Leptothoe sp. LEGE 181152]|nr:Ig-like domain-containing protein [Leptothoe sp. LEGE 181152]